MPCRSRVLHLIFRGRICWPRRGVVMGKKTVEFDAHKTVKVEKEISFTKKDGTPVEFDANVPTKVPVHVKFKADPDKKK